MRAAVHADYTSQTVGYDYYFAPTPASADCCLANFSSDPGWAACAVVEASFRMPDGSDKPVHFPPPGDPNSLCHAQDLSQPISHFALQLAVEKADATMLVRLGAWR